MRRLARVFKRDWKALRAKGAIDADQAVLADHFGALLLWKASEHRADIVRIAAATLRQGQRIERSHLLFLVEQAPGQVVERQFRVDELVFLERSGEDGDVRPIGVIEPRVQALASL